MTNNCNKDVTEPFAEARCSGAPGQLHLKCEACGGRGHTIEGDADNERKIKCAHCSGRGCCPLQLKTVDVCGYYY